MIDRAHDLPIAKAAEVLRISRGGAYDRPQPVPDADLAIMRRLDRLHLRLDRLHLDTPSPVRGCCAACWPPRGARSAVGT